MLTFSQFLNLDEISAHAERHPRDSIVRGAGLSKTGSSRAHGIISHSYVDPKTGKVLTLFKKKEHHHYKISNKGKVATGSSESELQNHLKESKEWSAPGSAVDHLQKHGWQHAGKDFSGKNIVSKYHHPNHPGHEIHLSGGNFIHQDTKKNQDLAWGSHTDMVGHLNKFHGVKEAYNSFAGHDSPDDKDDQKSYAEGVPNDYAPDDYGPRVAAGQGVMPEAFSSPEDHPFHAAAIAKGFKHTGTSSMLGKTNHTYEHPKTGKELKLSGDNRRFGLHTWHHDGKTGDNAASMSFHVHEDFSLKPSSGAAGMKRLIVPSASSLIKVAGSKPVGTPNIQKSAYKSHLQNKGIKTESHSDFDAKNHPLHSALTSLGYEHTTTIGHGGALNHHEHIYKQKGHPDVSLHSHENGHEFTVHAKKKVHGYGPAKLKKTLDAHTGMDEGLIKKFISWKDGEGSAYKTSHHYNNGDIDPKTIPVFKPTWQSKTSDKTPPKPEVKEVKKP